MASDFVITPKFEKKTNATQTTGPRAVPKTVPDFSF